MSDAEEWWRLMLPIVVPCGTVIVGCLVAMAWRWWKGPTAWRWFEEGDE
jgi:hypothetical protein